MNTTQVPSASRDFFDVTEPYLKSRLPQSVLDSLAELSRKIQLVSQCPGLQGQALSMRLRNRRRAILQYLKENYTPAAFGAVAGTHE